MTTMNDAKVDGTGTAVASYNIHRSSTIGRTRRFGFETFTGTGNPYFTIKQSSTNDTSFDTRRVAGRRDVHAKENFDQFDGDFRWNRTSKWKRCY